MANSDIVRVLRLLEYVGPREKVENDLAQRGVKGEASFSWNGQKVVIREALLGDFPEVMVAAEAAAEARDEYLAESGVDNG